MGVQGRGKMTRSRIQAMGARSFSYSTQTLSIPNSWPPKEIESMSPSKQMEPWNKSESSFMETAAFTPLATSLSFNDPQSCRTVTAWPLIEKFSWPPPSIKLRQTRFAFFLGNPLNIHFRLTLDTKSTLPSASMKLPSKSSFFSSTLIEPNSVLLLLVKNDSMDAAMPSFLKITVPGF